MIRALRNSGIGQILIGGIVVAIIAAFILSGANPGGTGTESDECVAQVGEHCVQPKDFDAAFRLLSSIGINESAAKRLNLREKVARGLAERELLVEEAQKIGIATSEDDIDNELLEGRTRVSLPADGAEQLAMNLAMCVDGPSGCEPGTVGLRAIDVKTDGKFDIEVYKRSIRVWTRRSPGLFKDMQKREYTAERLRQLIRSTVRISEDEAFLAYSRVRNKATARTVSVNTDWFERYVVDSKSIDLADYLGSHKDPIEEALKGMDDQYKVGCPVVSEIRIDSADPGSDEAKAAKDKADKLLLSVKIKRNFADEAKKSSQADSAALGGFVGCLDENYGAGSTELLEAALALKNPGDVSPVIETIRGFTILRLEDVVTEENRKDVMSRAVARELAISEAAQKAAEDFSKELIAKAKAGENLEEATKALVASVLGLKADEESPAANDDKAPRVEISRSVSIDQDVIEGAKPDETPTMALFKLEKDGDTFSDPIKTEAGYSVLQLKNKEILTKEAFAEDRERIMQTLQARKAEDALAQFVDELVKRAGGIKFNEKFVPPADAEEKDKDS